MGIAKLIVLGAGLGVGAVGLDRGLVMVGAADTVSPRTAVVAPVSPRAPVSVPPLMQRVSAGGVPAMAPFERPSEASIAEFARRYAMVRPADGYRVVAFRCEGPARLSRMPVDGVSARVREALESLEASRGL